MTHRPRLLYLSGAPRVSTRSDCAEPGPRTHVLGVIDAFSALGWEVRQCILGDHLPIRRGRTDGGRIKPWPQVLCMDALRLTLDAAARTVVPSLASGCRLVYERLGLLQALGLPLAGRSGLPWVVETQGLMWRDALDRHAVRLVGLAQQRERAIYRACTHIVAVSPAVRDDVVDFAGVDPAKVIVIPNGVDIARFNDGPPRPPPHAVLRIGFVGTLLHWQNLDLLVRALRTVRARGIPAEVHIAGDGAEAAPLRALAVECGLAAQVHWLGRIAFDAVPAFLRHMDLGYAGHRKSAGRTMYHSPLKLYEYAASGLPFIASDHDDARTLCPSSASWLLFDPVSEDDLIRAITAAWNHREALPSLGAGLRQLACDRLSWHGRVQGLLAHIGVAP